MKELKRLRKESNTPSNGSEYQRLSPIMKKSVNNRIGEVLKNDSRLDISLRRIDYS